MADALAAGTIDGYCVGEPWNTASVALGLGRIATVKAAIWRGSPEKVLGVQAQWADTHPEALIALLRALYRAAIWCADLASQNELAVWLGSPTYIDRPPEWMVPARPARSTSAAGRWSPWMSSLCRWPRRRPFHGIITRSGSTVKWCAGGRSATAKRTRRSRAKRIAPTFIARRSSRSVWRCPEPTPRSRRARAGNARRLRRREPGARARRIFRWQPLRSRPDRRLYRGAEPVERSLNWRPAFARSAQNLSGCRRQMLGHWSQTRPAAIGG